VDMVREDTATAAQLRVTETVAVELETAGRMASVTEEVTAAATVLVDSTLG